MSMKHIILAGAAIAALSAGAVVAHADTRAEEDAATRELNLDQLEAARDGTNLAPDPDTDATEDRSTDDAEDGHGGGPYYKAPPMGWYDSGSSTPEAMDESALDEEDALDESMPDDDMPDEDMPDGDED